MLYASYPVSWKVTPINVIFHIDIDSHPCICTSFLGSSVISFQQLTLQVNISIWTSEASVSRLSLLLIPFLLEPLKTTLCPSSLPQEANHLFLYTSLWQHQVAWTRFPAPRRCWTEATLQMHKHFTSLTKKASSQKQQEKQRPRALGKIKGEQGRENEIASCFLFDETWFSFYRILREELSGWEGDAEIWGKGTQMGWL